MFGLPGGPELLIIGGIIVLLFVPSAAFFAIGYFVGRRSGAAAPDSARSERSDGDD
ncbi:MAG: hypothetical protein VB139_04480 [Coriobacteriia bacterium]|nr:hypothetical protein [Coriobacteriia bacterium]